MFKKKLRAFTLIELIIVLLITAIAFFFCFPFNQKIYNKTQIIIIEKEIAQVIQYARNMALISGSNLTLNPFPTSGDWSKGMVLFVDNKGHHFTETDQILHQWQWNHHPLQIKWYGFNSNNFLIISNSFRHSTSSGHFSILHEGIEVGRVIVNRIGRILEQNNEPTKNGL